jgi:hypothetical protein
MFWKLIAANAIFWMIATFFSSRLRAKFCFLSSQTNNMMTTLAMKNCLKILSHFLWILILFICTIFLPFLNSFVIIVMVVLLIHSFIDCFRVSTPFNKEIIMLKSGADSGYGLLILTFVLVIISRICCILIATNIL